MQLLQNHSNKRIKDLCTQIQQNRYQTFIYATDTGAFLYTIDTGELLDLPSEMVPSEQVTLSM